jgi:hypothetical protein
VPAGRAITSIYYFRLKRWSCRSGLNCEARVSLHASFVPDSHSKLATAVTRARADHPSFFCYSAPSQISFRLLGRAHSRKRYSVTEPSKSGASLWDVDKKPGLATDGLISDG